MLAVLRPWRAQSHALQTLVANAAWSQFQPVPWRSLSKDAWKQAVALKQLHLRMQVSSTTHLCGPARRVGNKQLRCSRCISAHACFKHATLVWAFDSTFISICASGASIGPAGRTH
eukprot:362032-Chlamydomonas_euryale.AAC.3